MWRAVSSNTWQQIKTKGLCSPILDKLMQNLCKNVTFILAGGSN